MTERDASDEPWTTGLTRDEEPITNRCEFCAWYTVADSYAVGVERYQDHLRAEHPDAWLRT